MANSIDIKVEGVEDVIKEIQKIQDDKLKRKNLLRVYREAAKHIREAAKANAPVSEQAHKYQRAGKTENVVIPSGALRESIGIFASKSKMYPSVYVGPRVKGKYKYMGWYGHFMEYGTESRVTKDGKATGRIEGARYLTKAYEATKGIATRAVETHLRDLIVKK